MKRRTRRWHGQVVIKEKRRGKSRKNNRWEPEFFFLVSLAFKPSTQQNAIASFNDFCWDSLDFSHSNQNRSVNRTLMQACCCLCFKRQIHFSLWMESKTEHKYSKRKSNILLMKKKTVCDAKRRWNRRLKRRMRGREFLWKWICLTFFFSMLLSSTRVILHTVCRIVAVSQAVEIIETDEESKNCISITPSVADPVGNFSYTLTCATDASCIHERGREQM